MSDRDELADLIHTTQGWLLPVNPVAELVADAILARWRLVPVEEQHRAADELTHHDQTAGHYRDDLAAGLYVPPRRRTDQHGPHED